MFFTFFLQFRKTTQRNTKAKVQKCSVFRCVLFFLESQKQLSDILLAKKDLINAENKAQDLTIYDVINEQGLEDIVKVCIHFFALFFCFIFFFYSSFN